MKKAPRQSVTSRNTKRKPLIPALRSKPKSVRIKVNNRAHRIKSNGGIKNLMKNSNLRANYTSIRTLLPASMTLQQCRDIYLHLLRDKQGNAKPCIKMLFKYLIAMGARDLVIPASGDNDEDAIDKFFKDSVPDFIMESNYKGDRDNTEGVIDNIKTALRRLYDLTLYGRRLNIIHVRHGYKNKILGYEIRVPSDEEIREFLENGDRPEPCSRESPSEDDDESEFDEDISEFDDDEDEQEDVDNMDDIFKSKIPEGIQIVCNLSGIRGEIENTKGRALAENPKKEESEKKQEKQESEKKQEKQEPEKKQEPKESEKKQETKESEKKQETKESEKKQEKQEKQEPVKNDDGLEFFERAMSSARARVNEYDAQILECDEEIAKLMQKKRKIIEAKDKLINIVKNPLDTR
jgi:hypothetical protein